MAPIYHLRICVVYSSTFYITKTKYLYSETGTKKIMSTISKAARARNDGKEYDEPEDSIEKLVGNVF